jgi:hypothetical protein
VKKLSSSICILMWLIGLLGSAAVAQVIQISNIEELYSAVNNPANIGATLVLAPGNLDALGHRFERRTAAKWRTDPAADGYVDRWC